MENKEQEEINLLTGNGFQFETTFFGRKIQWNIGKITLGKMFQLSDVFIKMKVDEESVYSTDLSVQIPAQYQSVRDNAKLCAEAVAIAVEDQYWEVLPKSTPKWVPEFIKKRIKKVSEKIPLDVLTDHFFNSLDATETSKFALELLKFSNYQNFMTSTVLMNGNRPTKAMPIESLV